MPKKYKLGIFLEAGGNAVFFVNGVLKAFSREEINAEYIAGYSSSAAIMFAYIFKCFDFSLKVFGDQMDKNKKNFYFFRREHFPHNRIYRSSIESVFSNFGKNSFCYGVDFTVIATKISGRLSWLKALLASLVLFLNKNGLDVRKYFNRYFKVSVLEAGSDFKNKPQELVNIIMGSSCIYPFIGLHFFKNDLILEGGLLDPDYKKYLENCEKGIVVHTDMGKTCVRNGILHIYSRWSLSFNVLDYTNGKKLEVMQKAGEEEVWNNLDLIKKYIA